MTIKLQDAINNAKTFAELIPIAERIDAKLSFFGRQYAVMQKRNDDRSHYFTGEVPVGALVDRALEIITISYRRGCYYPKDCPERGESKLLDIQVNRIYDMDLENIYKSNIITKIIVMVKFLFNRIYNWNVGLQYINHQAQWRMGPDDSSVSYGLGKTLGDSLHTPYTWSSSPT